MADSAIGRVKKSNVNHSRCARGKPTRAPAVMLAPNVTGEAEPLANFSGSKLSGYPLKYQHSKKPKGSNHCPLEDHQTIIFEADLTGSCIKHEGNYCSQ